MSSSTNLRPSVVCRRLEGRVAIVTAATKGIGEAIAERLGREGAKVVIGSRQQKNVDETIARFKSIGIVDAVGIVSHVGKAEDRDRLVQLALTTFGRIDILVNNAGINPHFGDMMEISEEIWDKLFEVNVKAGFLMARAVVPHMEKSRVCHRSFYVLNKRGCVNIYANVVGMTFRLFIIICYSGGAIVFNASYGGYRPPPLISTYGVTKTAVLGLTKALANTLASKNIRVNCIAPGIIKTNMSRALWEGGKGEADHSEVLTSDIPMKRLGVPDECAGAVAFLVSDDSSYITGESIVIAGGIHARL